MREMTATEYLTARGWAESAARRGWWCDPVINRQAIVSLGADVGGAEICDLFCVTTNHALIIQRARDAEEERRAWVAFAAGCSSILETDGDTFAPSIAERIAVADDLLAAFVEGFAIEVTDPQT